MLKTSVTALAFLLLACGAGAAEPAIDPDLARGEAVYGEACAVCHGSTARLARRLPRTDQAEAKLDAFLAGHYAPEPQARADLIAYLLSL